MARAGSAWVMAGLLAVVVGCSPAATKTAGVTEGVISTDRTGKVRVAIAGQSFTLVTADGQAAPDAQIQIAGKTYAAQHGKLFLPDAALAARLTALAISAQTAAALASLPFAAVRVAARPNQDAMLALVVGS